MTSIGEFINEFRKLLQENKLVEPLDWNSLLENAGYYSIEFRPKTKDCYLWGREQFGPEHFAWTGSKLWFESEKDAVMFILRWGRGD